MQMTIATPHKIIFKSLKYMLLFFRLVLLFLIVLSFLLYVFVATVVVICFCCCFGVDIPFAVVDFELFMNHLLRTKEHLKRI